MRRFYIYFTAAAVILAGCAREISVQEPEIGPEKTEEQESVAFEKGLAYIFISDELNALVEKDLNDGRITTKSDALNDVVGMLGVQSMERLFPYAGEYEERTRAEGLHKWYKVTFDESVPVTKASSDFREVKGIEIIQPVRKVELDKFNDPYFKDQWHYYNSGSLGSYFLKGCDINVQPVWDNYTVGDPSVIVSVVDGGIDFQHEDIAGNYVGGYNFVSNGSVVKPHDHGTHVAGTIAAVNNNGIGVCGIAGGDAAAGKRGVGLLSCQVFETQSDGKSKSGDFATAIKWGADNGALISQNSWGFSYDTYADAKNDADYGIAVVAPAYKAAIDYFIKYAGCDSKGNQKADSPMKGGVFIMSAGNDNWDRDVIGEYEPVISVGSVGPNFGKAYYSTYGNWVDICAPGGDANISKGQVLSTLPGGSYGYMQGTSMACPHVSGVAALIISYFGRKGFTNDMLKERLLDGANHDRVSSALRIGPLVDAMGSFTLGGDTPPKPVTDFSTSVKSNFVTLKWNVTEDNYGTKAFSYRIAASKDKSALETLDFTKDVPASVKIVEEKVGTVQAGEEMSAVVDDLEFTTEYWFSIYASNYNGNLSDASPVKSVTTGENGAPTITPVDAHDIVLKSFQSETVTFNFSDPDGHEVTASVSCPSKAAKGKLSAEGVYALTIDAPYGDPGDYEAVVTVADKYGASASCIQKFRILENHPPVLTKSKDDVLLSRIGQRHTFDLSEFMADPDEEVLEYSCEVSSTNNLQIKVDGSKVELRALNFGDTVVKGRGKDAKGKTCTLEFRVLALDEEVPMDVYPNPVVNTLYIRVHQPSNVKYEIVSATGTKVVKDECEADPFNPVEIDFRNIAPGRYVLSAFFDGKDHRMNIVKN